MHLHYINPSYYIDFSSSQAMNILKYLFPVPKEDSRRVLTFANHDDFIVFRHHTYKKGPNAAKDIELDEVGPR